MKRIAIIALVLVVMAGTVAQAQSSTKSSKKNNTQTIYDDIASWSWSGKKASN